jgi:L-iditol 2-dehydrogenase
MLVRLAALRGARLVAVGRNAGRLRAAKALGAAETLALRPGEDPAARIGAVCDRGGPEVVIEAVGLPQTVDAAIRAVGRGGLVNLFAGCPAEAHVAVDAQRLHYQELTIRSTFHHTPKSVRQALQLITERRIDARAFITAEATLDDLPGVLATLARGGEGLKTAILTGPDEGPETTAAPD